MKEPLLTKKKNPIVLYVLGINSLLSRRGTRTNIQVTLKNFFIVYF